MISPLRITTCFFQTSLRAGLFALALSIATGCGSERPQAIEIDYEESARLASETEFIYYEDPGSPFVADIWLPENSDGVTHVEYWGDNATGSISKIVLHNSTGIALEIMAGPDYALVGTTAIAANGTTALLESVEGDVWTWTVVEPSGDVRTVTATPPSPPNQANLSTAYQTPIQFASQAQVSRPYEAVAKLAVSSAVAPVEIRNPDGINENALRHRVFSGSCQTSNPGAYCSVDVSPVTGELHVTNWVQTNLSDLPESAVFTYATEAECEQKKDNHNLTGVGLGTVIAVTGEVIVGGGFFVVGGILTAVLFNESEPTCSGLRTNEALLADAFTRFDDTRVDAAWSWSIPPRGSHRSTATADPAGISIQPFLNRNRGGMRLPPIVVTFRLDQPPEAQNVTEAATTEGSFIGQIDPAAFVSNPIASSDSPLTIEVDPDGLARVSADMTIVSRYDSRAGCWKGDGSTGGVQIGDDGSFQATLTFRGNYFDGPDTGDPCARLSPPENIPLNVSGQIDAASGSGTAAVSWPGGTGNVVLERQ